MLRLWVVAITVITVNGVITHPWLVRAIASQLSLFLFCFSLHDKKDMSHEDPACAWAAAFLDPVIAYII
jgi:hypothetical protein